MSPQTVIWCRVQCLPPFCSPWTIRTSDSTAAAAIFWGPKERKLEYKNITKVFDGCHRNHLHKNATKTKEMRGFCENAADCTGEHPGTGQRDGGRSTWAFLSLTHRTGHTTQMSCRSRPRCPLSVTTEWPAVCIQLIICSHFFWQSCLYVYVLTVRLVQATVVISQHPCAAYEKQTYIWTRRWIGYILDVRGHCPFIKCAVPPRVLAGPILPHVWSEKRLWTT